MEYYIPDQNMQKLVGKLEKLQKRAKKLAAGDIGFRVVRSEFQPAGRGVVTKVNVVEITGEAPIINGWRFIATIQHHTPGIRNIVRQVGVDPALGPEWWEVEPDCAHCGFDRQRKDTYVVENVGSGELKQVGSTCLTDFVGHTDPSEYARYFEYIHKACIGAETKEFDPYKGYHLELEGYLSWVAAEIRHHGWVPRSRAGEGRVPTANAAWHEMTAGPYREPAYQPTPKDAQTARTALEWVRATWAQQPLEELSDYQRNLVEATIGEHISGRELGLAASLISAWNRESEKHLQPTQVGGWLGKIGQKIAWEGQCIHTSRHDGTWGPYTLIKFLDRQGNILTWFSSVEENFEVGKHYRLQGTIKKHDEYRGEKQTIVTRVSERQSGHN